MMKADNHIVRASAAQVKYLHVLYRTVGWDEAMYREMLQANYAVRSTTDLTFEEASRFISLLHQVVKVMDNRITEKQVHLVRKLWAAIDYSGGKEGDAHLNAFVARYYKVARVQGLTRQDGIKLIKQIKQMTKQAEARKGQTTVLKRRTRCTHCGQWIMWVELKDGRREAFDCDDDRNPTNFHECR